MDRFIDKVMEYRLPEAGRREFLKTAAKGLVTTGILSGIANGAPGTASAYSKEDRIKRIASNSYSVRHLFKTASGNDSPFNLEMKRTYGTITMLDFPQFTKDTYPGVDKMDVLTALVGDVSDDSQFTEVEEGKRAVRNFDPAKISSKRWMDRFCERMVDAGVFLKHISNSIPRNICDLDDVKRFEGVRLAKVWLDAAKHMGARSMNVNTGSASELPAGMIEEKPPQKRQEVPFLKQAIKSYAELAEYGEKVGVKVTIENHWGLSANPMNIRIIIEEVGSPYCEASPDFCNWEHEYMLYHALRIVVPYASTMAHAKRWVRYPDVDIAQCVKIFTGANYRGYFSLEYELDDDPVQGTLQLMDDVVAALG